MMHEAIVFAALYVSEGWYTLWESRGMLKRGARPLYYKARALVVYDRILAQQSQGEGGE